MIFNSLYPRQRTISTRRILRIQLEKAFHFYHCFTQLSNALTSFLRLTEFTNHFKSILALEKSEVDLNFFANHLNSVSTDYITRISGLTLITYPAHENVDATSSLQARKHNKRLVEYITLI